MNKQWLINIRRGLTGGLTVIAFVNSYEHTKEWFIKNGQAQAGWLALIPEAGTLMVILSLAAGGLSRGQRAILGLVGLGSIAVTLTGNLAGAGPGVAGVAASLVAPLFFVTGFGLEILAMSHEPKVAHPDEPVSQAEPTREPVSQVSQGVIRPAGSVSLSVIPVSQPAPEPIREPLHLVAQPEPMSRVKTAWTDEEIQALAAKGMKNPEIVAHTGLSLATVKRKKKVA